jgi:hypothetical protein
LIISPTPAEVNVVEGILPVRSMRCVIKWEAVVLITLGYRAVTFWFAQVVGRLPFRLLQRRPATQPVAINKIE